MKDQRLERVTLFARKFLQVPPNKVELLKGDGSDRQIFHIQSSISLYNDMVGVIHENVYENNDFIFLSDEFKKQGFPVPEIFRISKDRTMYLQQYLGLHNLAEKIDEWITSEQQSKIVDAYKRVIEFLVRFQQPLSNGLGDFLKNRQMDHHTYREDLGYFIRCFLLPFELNHLYTKELYDELNTQILKKFSLLKTETFVYRDFQSRNVMWNGDSPWFIDYQSAFKGPKYYDLASLLYSSKSGLDDILREQLLNYYYEISDETVDYQEFEEMFYRFVILRRVRSLGSYGFLSLVKEKFDFFPRIGPTLEQIRALIKKQSCLKPFTVLLDVVEEIIAIWEDKSEVFLIEHNRTKAKRTIIDTL